MSTRTPTFVASALRAALTAVLALQWASSIVVLGISTFFVSNFDDGLSLKYEVIISALNAWTYGVGMFLPFIGLYKGYGVPIHIVFSYLWLTAFIFTAQDYNKNNCLTTAPDVSNTDEDCGRKFTLEAFCFLSFFFTFVAIFVEALLYVSVHYTARTRNVASAAGPGMIERSAVHPENETATRANGANGHGKV